MKMPWSGKWQPTPVFLPVKSHGQSRLMGYSPWDHRELDTTEHTHMHNTYLQKGRWKAPGDFTWHRNSANTLTPTPTLNPASTPGFPPGLANHRPSLPVLLLLLSHFGHVQLWATPSLGFSRQEHWSGLPFPSPTLITIIQILRGIRSLISRSTTPIHIHKQHLLMLPYNLTELNLLYLQHSSLKYLF